MLKLHWSIVMIIILCIVSISVIGIYSMVSGKEIPSGVIIIFTTTISGVLGYALGKNGN